MDGSMDDILLWTAFYCALAMAFRPSSFDANCNCAIASYHTQTPTRLSYCSSSVCPCAIQRSSELLYPFARADGKSRIAQTYDNVFLLSRKKCAKFGTIWIDEYFRRCGQRGWWTRFVGDGRGSKQQLRAATDPSVHGDRVSFWSSADCLPFHAVTCSQGSHFSLHTDAFALQPGKFPPKPQVAGGGVNIHGSRHACASCRNSLPHVLYPCGGYAIDFKRQLCTLIGKKRSIGGTNTSYALIVGPLMMHPGEAGGVEVVYSDPSIMGIGGGVILHDGVVHRRLWNLLSKAVCVDSHNCQFVVGRINV